MSMSLPSGTDKDLFRESSAAQRRATLSYPPRTDASRFVREFSLGEKIPVLVQVPSECVMT